MEHSTTLPALLRKEDVIKKIKNGQKVVKMLYFALFYMNQKGLADDYILFYSAVPLRMTRTRQKEGI